jgi:hypothetical protein
MRIQRSELKNLGLTLGLRVKGLDLDIYKYEKVGGTFVIKKDHQAVLTPDGKMFSTTDESLAVLLCKDLAVYGPNPWDSVSYVTFHCSYMDFGSKIAKSDLIANILHGYRTGWDIAVQQLVEFDSQYTSSTVDANPMGEGIFVDPTLFFGPLQNVTTIQTWLETLSTRALCSIQCCGAAFQSIHICYCLLQEHPQWPILGLAQGIIRYSQPLHKLLLVNGNPKATEDRVVSFLEKVRKYASYP